MRRELLKSSLIPVLLIIAQVISSHYQVSGHGITRNDAVSMASKAVNGSASGHPHFFYPGQQAGLTTNAHQPHVTIEADGRDPRQWMNGGYGSMGYGAPMWPGLGMFGGTEMILTCLLVVLGIGVIGLPFLLLILSAFTGGQGVNFIPPTTTTTVAGRKRRDTAANLFPSINPDIQAKLLDILTNFYKASDKMSSFKKLLNQ